MTTPSTDGGLWTVLEAYLAQRRALGFRLVEEERHCRRFLEWLQAHGHASTSFTVAQALSWAHGDGSLKNSYQAQRLSAIRGLASYCHAIGLDVQVPPAKALRTTRDRRRPHIYTRDEVDALIEACQHVFTHPLVGATMAAVIALLAVTGMRPGEAVRLRPGDINAEDATLLIRANKHGPDRLIPLHATTVDALAIYRTSSPRQAVGPPPEGPLFVTTRGRAYQRATVEGHFQRIRAATGITWEGTPPCLVDLRHTFATRQMIRAYTNDAGNPAATLGLLATWLGHSDPSHTYWYVQAVPELLALAAHRVDTTNTTE
ncbi:MAG: tyrosine-type recombinase/integrase [Propionicimonas sp.]